MIDLREAAQNVVDALIKNPTRVSKEVHIASVVLREILAQPEREWQGLTDEEIKNILDCGRGGLVDIKKAEAKLKEKNAC